MNKYIGTILGSLTLLMAGCTDDKFEVGVQPAAVGLTCSQMTVEGLETRAGTAEHTAINSEQVNVYMTNATTGTTAIVYTVAASAGGDGKSAMTSSTTPYLYYSQTPVYGLYPTGATMSEGTVSCSVNEDQSASNGANYKSSDLLFAKGSALRANASGGTVTTNIEFHHLMAKVIVNVATTTNMDVTGVWLVNVNKTLQFTPASYTIDHTTLTGLTTADNVGEGMNGAVQKGIKAGTASGCAALIPPQTFSGGNFVVIQAQGAGDKSAHVGKVTYAMTEPITFLPGRTYTLSLKVETWNFGETMTISVSDWSNNDNPENVEEPRLSI